MRLLCSKIQLFASPGEGRSAIEYRQFHALNLRSPLGPVVPKRHLLRTQRGHPLTLKFDLTTPSNLWFLDWSQRQQTLSEIVALGGWKSGQSMDQYSHVVDQDLSEATKPFRGLD